MSKKYILHEKIYNINKTLWEKIKCHLNFIWNKIIWFSFINIDNIKLQSIILNMEILLSECNLHISQIIGQGKEKNQSKP